MNAILSKSRKVRIVHRGGYLEASYHSKGASYVSFGISSAIDDMPGYLERATAAFYGRPIR